MTFSHPVFVRLSVKLDRASKELDRLENHMHTYAVEIANGEWGAVSALALGIHNIYNGIEDVLQSLANDIDGSVPGGESAHQDLLDQMYGQIPGVRPQVLDDGLYSDLTELKGFRHHVMHRYGFDLKADRVVENAHRAEYTLPAFIVAVEALERSLLEELDEDKTHQPDGNYDPAGRPR